MGRARQLLTEMYEWGNALMWSLAVLSVPFWLYLFVYVAPDAQIIAAQQAQATVWHESLVFCERHGMPAETPRHLQCVSDLIALRAQDAQRIASAAEALP